MAERGRPSPRPQPSRPEPRAGFVAVGYVRRPRGARGELTVEPLTDFPARFAPGAAVWAGERRYTVRRARPHKDTLLIELEEIGSPEGAEALRGLLLEVPEDELPALAEGEYYRHQLVGLEVFDRAGNALGRLEAVIETGANDVYAVRSEEGELLLPAIDTVIKEVDVGAGRMVVELLPGLERKPPGRRR